MEKRFFSTLSSESAADNVTACCLSFVRVSRIPLLVTELLNHIRKRQEYVFYGSSTGEWERHFRWLDRHCFGHINSEEKKKTCILKFVCRIRTFTGTSRQTLLDPDCVFVEPKDPERLWDSKLKEISRKGLGM